MLTASTLLLSLLAADTPGDVALGAAAGTVQGERFLATGVETRFELTAGTLRGRVRIDGLALPGAGYRIDDIDIVCDRVRLTNRSVYCDAGRLTARLPAVGVQTLSGSFSYSRDPAKAHFELENEGFAGGRWRIAGEAGAGGFDMEFHGAGADLGELIGVGARFDAGLAEYSGAGRLVADGRVRGADGGPTRLELRATTEDGAFANAPGTVAAERLRGELVLDLRLGAEDARFDLRVDAQGGEAYLEPVYLGFDRHALHVEARDIATADFDVFELSGFRLRHDSLIDATGRGRIVVPDAEGTATEFSGSVELADSSLQALYESVVKVTMAGTFLGSLETAGKVSGQLTISRNAPTSARLELRDVILDDEQGRFAFYGLDGTVDWPGTADRPAEVSTLRWDSATAYNILFEGADARLHLGPADAELLAPLEVRTMGGALRINRLAVHDFGSASATGVLDAELEPVQLGQLTTALGWPAFSGRLSGRLPLMQLEGDTVTVGGSLTATAFDGDIEIANLRIEQPFGRVPRLQADIRLRELDLARITNVFSFGAIEGRLSGDVEGLRMAGWRTIAMDMHLYTPAGDRSPHRISQRAVENLASVGGGGATAALSSGLLGFFDVFAYDRIGLRCVLRDGTCMMSGAGPAGRDGPAGGYYIVKGKGVPRIDVVGFRDKVSWPRLVRQLEEITRRGPAIVE